MIESNSKIFILPKKKFPKFSYKIVKKFHIYVMHPTYEVNFKTQLIPCYIHGCISIENGDEDSLNLTTIMAIIYFMDNF